MSHWKRKLSEIRVKDLVTSSSMVTNNIQEIEKEYELYTAAELGDYKKIAQLLSLGISVEGEHYEQSLHHFCKNHHMTPLLVAAANGHVKCVQTLITHGANINAIDKFGCTAIHFAIESANYTCLKILLEAKADCNVSCHRSYKTKALHVRGTTPLHLAATFNFANFVKTLIKFGADCDAIDENGHTSLYIASKAGFEQCVLVILRNSCNLSSLSLPSFDTSETPLHHAVKHRMVECIKEMVHLGSDVNHICNDGFSPLHLFVNSHNEKSCLEMEILKLLVVDGYNTNINCITDEGKTALDFALFSIYWDPEFTKYLISYGAESYVMSSQSFLSYHLSMPLNDVLFKCFVKTMPHVPRLKTIFSTLLIEYPTELHSKLEYKIVKYADNLYVEVIDHEVDNIVGKLGHISICRTVSNYVQYPLEQPYLNVIYERLVEKLEHMDDTHMGHLHDYYKNYLVMIKKRLWYEKIASVPPTLQHCCRLSVRKYLGPSRLRHIKKLPVPEKMLSYLLLQSY